MSRHQPLCILGPLSASHLQSTTIIKNKNETLTGDYLVQAAHLSEK